jgi:hypothetical protein
MVSRPRRISIASDRPSSRALSRWCGGSLSARMAMKIRLSMPRTISRTTSVSNPAQIVGSNSHSMFLPCQSENSKRRRRQFRTRAMAPGTAGNAIGTWMPLAAINRRTSAGREQADRMSGRTPGSGRARRLYGRRDGMAGGICVMQRGRTRRTARGKQGSFLVDDVVQLRPGRRFVRIDVAAGVTVECAGQAEVGNRGRHMDLLHRRT